MLDNSDYDYYYYYYYVILGNGVLHSLASWNRFYLTQKYTTPICLFYPWILSLPFTYLLIFDRSLHFTYCISMFDCCLRFFCCCCEVFYFCVLQKIQGRRHCFSRREDTVVNTVFFFYFLEFLFLALLKPIKNNIFGANNFTIVV